MLFLSGLTHCEGRHLFVSKLRALISLSGSLLMVFKHGICPCSPLSQLLLVFQLFFLLPCPDGNEREAYWQNVWHTALCPTCLLLIRVNAAMIWRWKCDNDMDTQFMTTEVLYIVIPNNAWLKYLFILRNSWRLKFSKLWFLTILG